MKALIQRVTSSSVEVDGTNVGQINKGLLVFIGIEKLDELSHADKMINKILSYHPKDIQIGVLIERTHKSFPLSANFKGLELSTSEFEHVEVRLNESPKVIIT